jgi:D-hydroxyproline dehydrogenase subunit beta
VQHPYDPALVPLHEETVALYRDLGVLEGEPAGVLVLGRDRAAVEPHAAAAPELEPELLDARAAEPAVAEGIAACRLRSGYPIPPLAATLAFAELAREAGAVLHTHSEAALSDLDAGAVLVAAGPWTPEVVDPSGAWRPIAPVWGVNVELALADPPRAILEEGGVAEAHGGGAPPSLFSLVTVGGVSALGSTFLDREPDPARHAPELLRRGAAFVPELARAAPVSVRACARPQSFDGRPLLGAVRDGVYVAAGHGPWGISVGPASARLVADAILGRGDPIPAALDAARACAA